MDRSWLRSARSMKAGALTPATPCVRTMDRSWLPSTLNEGGGSHPRNARKDLPQRRRLLEGSTLNEGGGSHPRNAFRPGRVHVIGLRSMKAGALTPATPTRSRRAPGASHRSMKAGALTPATPACPTVWPQKVELPERSMKAGALTPATRRRSWRTRRRCPSLNEGGGSHPRNAPKASNRPSGRQTLNEGGGSHPRNANGGCLR